MASPPPRAGTVDTFQGHGAPMGPTSHVTFGEYDGFNLWEAPDNVSMVAVAIVIGGGGALSKFETTVLMTVEETLEALARVDAVHYRPPGE